MNRPIPPNYLKSAFLLLDFILFTSRITMLPKLNIRKIYDVLVLPKTLWKVLCECDNTKTSIKITTSRGQSPRQKMIVYPDNQIKDIFVQNLYSIIWQGASETLCFSILYPFTLLNLALNLKPTSYTCLSGPNTFSTSSIMNLRVNLIISENDFKRKFTSFSNN